VKADGQLEQRDQHYVTFVRTLRHDGGDALSAGGERRAQTFQLVHR
jgi:hypothetical protein